MAIRHVLASALFVVLLALSGCVAPQPAEKPALVTRGEVVVYLEPLPQAARHLRFELESMSALAADGTPVSLNLDFYNVRANDLLDRQKRLAVAQLTPGSYSGLSVNISSARLLGEKGEAQLLHAGGPVTAQRPFTVRPRQATALFLRLDNSGVKPGGIQFAPSFSLHPAKRQAFNLHGYVSCAAVNRVTVFNKRTLRVTDVIATGRRPSGIAVAPRRRRVYIACAGDHRIEEIDVLTGEVVGVIELQFGDGPRELAVTPDERILVATHYESDTASIIDLGARVETARVSVGRRPLGVVIDDTGALAFVANSLSNSVSVLDIELGRRIAELPVETSPLHVAFEPGGRRLFVIHRHSPNLLVFDGANLTLLGKVFAGIGATSIAQNPVNRLVYVGTLSGDIQVFSSGALTFIDSIPAGPGALANILIEEEESRLFAVRKEDRTLLKIDITGKRALQRLETEEEPYAVAVIGER